ncbi:MAG: hypothetical protein KatS3mg115_2277 [Candidatus Poribacteria bacterium]|nr:MAG: hypothetical protein KatS3mg115_2277 [Candidatus Poribacteria bacterium]
MPNHRGCWRVLLSLAMVWVGWTALGCGSVSGPPALLIRGTPEEPVLRSGDLSGSEIWAGTIVVRGAVRVPQGATLTIERGSHVQFSGGAENPGRLIVHGMLYVQGDFQEPVLFTGTPELREWQGLILAPTASGRIHEARFQAGAQVLCRSDGMVFSFSEFLQNSGTALTLEDASPTVEDCEFRLNVVGIRVVGQASPQILNNTFLGNVYGVVCEDGARPTIARNLFANQREHGVLVRGAASPEIRENNFIRNGGFAVLDGGRLIENFIQGNNGAPPNAVERSSDPQSLQVFGVEEVLSPRAVPVAEAGVRRVR